MSQNHGSGARRPSKNYEGCGVVITGAASGIGLAFAKLFLELGSNVLLSDVRAHELDEVGQSLIKRYNGLQVRTLVTDVTDLNSMNTLAETAFRELGRVDYLFLNAGVYDKGSQYKNLKAWKWLMDVNVGGVVHGLHSFVPGLIAQIKRGHPSPVHIVTTASICSFLTAVLGTYSVSKFAVCGVMEALYTEIQDMGPKISNNLKIHTIHPSFAQTTITTNSESLRPDGTGEPDKQHNLAIREGLKLGVDMQQLVYSVLVGMEERKFYLHPDPLASETCLVRRVQDIMTKGSPSADIMDDPRIQPLNSPQHVSKL